MHGFYPNSERHQNKILPEKSVRFRIVTTKNIKIDGSWHLEMETGRSSEIFIGPYGKALHLESLNFQNKDMEKSLFYMSLFELKMYIHVGLHEIGSPFSICVKICLSTCCPLFLDIHVYSTKQKASQFKAFLLKFIVNIEASVSFEKSVIMHHTTPTRW
jgi:hypothetical protein